jgi:hypothetical protein
LVAAVSCCALETAAPAPPLPIVHLWDFAAVDLGNNVAMRWLHSASSVTSVSSAEDAGTFLVSKAGTLTELRVRIQTALAAGRDTAFTVRVNGVATALTVTVTGGNQTGVVTGSVAVAVGDRITVSTVTSVADGTTSRPRATVLFQG